MPLFQNESKCETFYMKMSSAWGFIFIVIKAIFIREVSHLTQRHKGAQNGLLQPGVLPCWNTLADIQQSTYISLADWAKYYKHNNGIMCYLNNCSLFTNVPFDETIQICLDKLNALPDSPAIPRPILKKLLKFATKKSHFIFYTRHYDHIAWCCHGPHL